MHPSKMLKILKYFYYSIVDCSSSLFGKIKNHYLFSTPFQIDKKPYHVFGF